MKKILSMLLAVLMLFSATAPVTVFAENGPYPYDPESEEIDFYEFSMLTLMDYETYNMGVLYPQDASLEMPDVYSGASYDLETNTLTLKNVKSKASILTAYEMGDDFKIKLIGYNELGCIMSSSESRGGSITFTGNGELVVNREQIFGGIYVDAGSTASFVHIEDSVKLKAYSDPDYDQYAIAIIGSTITDSSEIIKLGGNVEADEPEFEKYIVDIYEQAEVYDLSWNYYDWYEAGLEKDGAYYVADLEYDEESYEETGYYLVYPVTYDELIDCYILGEPSRVKNFDGYTVITQDFEPMYDEGLGYYIGYTDYPDEPDDSYKTIFDPYEKEYIDLCVDANGTKYGFYQYDYEIEDEEGNIESGVDVYVYNLIEHPDYGTIAVEDPDRTTMDGLTPVKIGEKELADSYISSDVIINNGGSVVEPATIKGIKAKSTNQGVKVSWSANSTAERYRVYRKLAGKDDWTFLGSVTADKTSYIDKTAKSGKKYVYSVKGVNFVGAGKLNQTGVTHTYYEAPDVTVRNISTGINLKWAKVAGATKYRIYRRTSGSSSWYLIDTVTGTAFTDKHAKSGKKYYYRVRAGKSDVMSGYNEVSKYYLAVPELSSIKNTDYGIKIRWEEVNGADRYKVYRKYGTNSYEYIGTTENTYYTDKTVKSGRKYTYTVKAAKSKTNSVYDKTGLTLKAQ